ncbi:MAG: hypothetical protein KBG28_11725 [Kofleriaceae bacterium]|nr:hypothetical protein [Kofleriaceae bacterium]
MLGLVISIAVVAIAIGAAQWWNSEHQTTKRTLRTSPRITVSAMAHAAQPGRLVGVAEVVDGTLTSPVTGRPCVFYQATIEELVSTGKSSQWRQRAHERRGVVFALRDETGRALVDAATARIALTIDGRSQSGVFDDATAAEQAFLARHGMSSSGWFLNKRLRYHEAVIEPGERIAVLGRGEAEPDPDGATGGGYREGPALRVVITGTAKAPVLLSDHPDALR